jgi:hypothetical protein
MKKNYFIAAIILMTGFASTAMAQTTGNTDNDHITGSATVMQAITVTPDQNLNLGMVSPNVAKTINLNGKTSGGQASNGTELTGRFIVSAGAGTDVNVQFTTLPPNLVYNTNNDLAIAYTAGYHTAIPPVGDVFPGITFATASTLTNIEGGVFPTHTIGSANAIYVFLGATVSPTDNQVAGLYEGTITLTATYN